MNDEFLQSCLGPVLPVGVPETRAVAIMTANGQSAVDGSSHTLGSPMDAALLQRVRWWSDVVLVGAETVRAENYGGVAVPGEMREERASRSQAGVPPIAVVTRSGDLDPNSRLFQDTATAPLILMPKVGESVQLPGARVIEVPDEDYVSALRRLGFARIALEGGPGMYAQTLRHHAVDIFHLTIDPSMMLGASAPLLRDAESESAQQKMTLEHCAPDPDGCVFLRYRLTN